MPSFKTHQAISSTKVSYWCRLKNREGKSRQIKLSFLPHRTSGKWVLNDPDMLYDKESCRPYDQCRRLRKSIADYEKCATKGFRKCDEQSKQQTIAILVLPKNYGAVKFELNLENQRMTIMGVQAPNTIGSCFLHLIFTFNFYLNMYLKH